MDGGSLDLVFLRFLDLRRFFLNFFNFLKSVGMLTEVSGLNCNDYFPLPPKRIFDDLEERDLNSLGVWLRVGLALTFLAACDCL